MEERDLLFEQYEDALFRLWMDRVAEEEGRKLLEENERLKADPAAAIPETTIARCRKAMAKAFHRRDGLVMRGALKRLIYIVALVALIGSIMVGTAVAIIPGAKERLFNLIVEVLDTNTKFGFGNSQADALPLDANWLPEGFELTDRGSDKFSSWKTYACEDSYVSVYTCAVETVVHSVDTEDAYCEDIMIQGDSAQFVDTGYELHITISVAGGKIVGLMSEGISREELVKVAENLSW